MDVDVGPTDVQYVVRLAPVSSMPSRPALAGAASKAIAMASRKVLEPISSSCAATARSTAVEPMAIATSLYQFNSSSMCFVSTKRIKEHYKVCTRKDSFGSSSMSRIRCRRDSGWWCAQLRRSQAVAFTHGDRGCACFGSRVHWIGSARPWKVSLRELAAGAERSERQVAREPWHTTSGRGRRQPPTTWVEGRPMSRGVAAATGSRWFGVVTSAEFPGGALPAVEAALLFELTVPIRGRTIAFLRGWFRYAHELSWKRAEPEDG